MSVYMRLCKAKIDAYASELISINDAEDARIEAELSADKEVLETKNGAV